MSSQRSYNQYCALAKSLDLLGKRWTLLLVRELLSGPKRFTDLHEGLPGIGTNLLSDRLKELQNHNVIEKTELPPPAGSTVYQLTDRGEDLEPVIRSLQQWGLDLLGEPEESEYFHPRWALEGMLATFNPEHANNLNHVFEFHIEEETFSIRVADGEISGEMGPSEDYDVRIEADSDSFLELALEETNTDDLLETGRVRIEGDSNLLTRLMDCFAIEQER